MSFQDFYAKEYIERHPVGVCRLLHILGVPASIIPVAVACWLQLWWPLLFLPVPTYLLAWLGHLAVHNKPTAFEHPLWSMRGYWKMVAAMLTGRISILRGNR